MAMSFAVTGLRAPGVRILDPGCVAKTFPTFFERLDELVGEGTGLETLC
jgi:3-phosphoshikimate 1-carboxyvinyltransferase